MNTLGIFFGIWEVLMVLNTEWVLNSVQDIKQKAASLENLSKYEKNKTAVETLGKYGFFILVQLLYLAWSLVALFSNDWHYAGVIIMLLSFGRLCLPRTALNHVVDSTVCAFVLLFTAYNIYY